MQSYAGFWQRIKAFAFDYAGIVLYLGFITGLFAFVNSSTDIVSKLFTDRVLAQTSAFLMVTLPITMYFALRESSTRQATWGKQRLGLKVTDRDGNQINYWRAFARTLLKFVPWELSHTLIWEINFSGGSFSTVMNYGFALVYVLIGLNFASIVMTRTRQSLYDLLSGTFVVSQQKQ